MSAWLYDPVADLAFQSDDPPGTSPLRASKLTRFAFVPLPQGGLGRVAIKANCYEREFGGALDPIEYVPIALPMSVPSGLSATLDSNWAAIQVARGSLVQMPNGADR